MSSTSATFYNTVYKNGSLVLNNKLNPIYIDTSTGSLTSNIMGYLVNISSDVQTQLNAKQSILWNYNAGTSPNAYYLSPSSNCSLNIVRTDTVNASYTLCVKSFEKNIFGYYAIEKLFSIIFFLYKCC